LPVQTGDPHKPTRVSLPESMLRLLDARRGRIPRSAYILEILETFLGKAKGRA
jgi:hypothetical protein